MRKFTLLILLILFSENVISQTMNVPGNFKIGNFKPVNSSEQFDNPFSSSVIVNPVKSATPISNFITDILKIGDTVWFATGNGLMRTTDNFNSFDGYFGVDPFGEDDIAGFTLNSRMIVASTAVSEEINGESVPTGTGIKVSTDFGLNWSAYPQPIDTQTDSVVIYGSNTIYALPVVVRQQNLSYDIAVTRAQNDPNNYVIWICSFAGGLRKSTDYGSTWQRVLLPPDNLDSININASGYNFELNPRDNLNHRVFSITAVNDSTLYVGTANGINKTSSWGVNWRKYNFLNTDPNGSGNGISGNFVVSMDVQKYAGKEIVWGATRRAESSAEFDALSFSSNGGANWVSTLVDLKPNGMSFKDSIVYGFTDAGLWRANFGNFNWAKTGLIYDERTRDQLRTNQFYAGNYFGDTLYFGSADGLLQTLELGQPWIGKWRIFRRIDPINLSSETKTYAAPNPFAPDDEVTRIFYKSTKDVSKITIKIFDFAMNPVRVLIQNATRSGTNELFTAWDGKNDNGAFAANGVYFYRVEIEGEDDVWGKILLLQ
ncbi:MAG: hypothetical protein IPG02_19000 [Ignavibacteria bacterium]|jgi:hypothetical protein|nr:hypothetical protein [Ignavibacteria bacterium]